MDQGGLVEPMDVRKLVGESLGWPMVVWHGVFSAHYVFDEMANQKFLKSIKRNVSKRSEGLEMREDAYQISSQNIRRYQTICQYICKMRNRYFCEDWYLKPSFAQLSSPLSPSLTKAKALFKSVPLSILFLRFKSFNFSLIFLFKLF